MPAFLPPVTPSSPLPGTVVSTWVFPFFRHTGIVSDHYFDNRPMVISNSARTGGVGEEPWDIFSAGQNVRVEGYPSSLPSSAVVHRARALIGTQYHLLNWNCEHLTSYAHGLAPKSPQVAFIIAAALVAGMMALAGD
jgi:hypothetical protein